MSAREAPEGVQGAEAEPPLYVDLDGTLIKTDLLQEGLVALFKTRPWLMLMVPLWLARGRAHLKQQICTRAPLDASTLPYSSTFLAYLREEHATGRRLILTTGSPSVYARGVAEYLGIFDNVLCSDSRTNLIGRNKLARIKALHEDGVFDYAGNAGVDLRIWSACRNAVVVNASRRVRSRVGNRANVVQTFRDRKQTLPSLIRTLRPHQWVKNILLFAPAIAAHSLLDANAFLFIALAFCGFSAAASAGYVFNDVLDASADRLHPRKRKRPFASGDLYPFTAVALIPGLLLVAALVCIPLPPAFSIVLAGYLAINLAYSLWLKRKVMIDVFILAGLYTLRIFAGATAISMGVSSWLLAFSVFLFLSLALIKRYAELFPLLEGNVTTGKLSRRGYHAGDANFVLMAGLASAFTADVILALYINSPAVVALYSRPQILWGLCALVLFWILRLWFVTTRGGMHDDPIVYAIRDRGSLLLGACCALLLWVAS